MNEHEFAEGEEIEIDGQTVEVYAVRDHSMEVIDDSGASHTLYRDGAGWTMNGKEVDVTIPTPTKVEKVAGMIDDAIEHWTQEKTKQTYDGEKVVDLLRPDPNAVARSVVRTVPGADAFETEYTYDRKHDRYGRIGHRETVSVVYFESEDWEVVVHETGAEIRRE